MGGAYLLVDERRGERYVRMPPTDHPALRGRHGALRPHRPHRRHLPPPGVGRGRRLSPGGEPDRSPVLPPRVAQARLAARQRAARWWASTTCTTPAGSTGGTGTSSGSATSRGSRRRASASSGLPRWMYVYSLGRHVYAYVPPGLEARPAARRGEVAGARPVRILLLSTSMGMGGRRPAAALGGARAFGGAGHEVRIVSLTPLGEMGARARAAGLATESLEMRRGIRRSARPGPAGPAGARMAAHRAPQPHAPRQPDGPRRPPVRAGSRRSSPPSTTSTRAAGSG